ncbi:MAG: hypothetical protein KGP35_06315 [Bacteroidetes bacterium]|nr:hypothetical protein [Bacteroidota bacterium]
MSYFQSAGYCLIFFISVASCTTTRIDSSWKDPQFQNTAFKKIIVAGIMEGKKRKSLQLSFESHAVNDLKMIGYTAKAASDVYGLRGINGKSEGEILQMLKKDGYDAAITFTLLDINKEKSYVQGHLEFWPGGFYFNRFGRYYSYWYKRIYSPGYYVTNTTYIVEGNVFELGTDKLIFTAQTESIDPSSVDNLAHRISRSLVQSMQEKNIFP